jgi:hypothetical protein
LSYLILGIALRGVSLFVGSRCQLFNAIVAVYI